MKFKMNNRTWEIKEIEQKDFFEDGQVGEGFFYGKCVIYKQEIWLDNKLNQELKRKTLLHELMHCYLASFITFDFLNNTSEEIWCDMVANSHDMINEIVNKYFGSDINEHPSKH